MFPISLDLSGKLVLLVGAGRVGRRKLAKLLAAGVRLRLVEPRPDRELKGRAEAGELELHECFQPELMEGAVLVFAATDSPELNRQVALEARRRGLWVNVADAPELSDFALPAVVERGAFQLAVATGGGSPALAAKVAEELRAAYGPEYGRLAAVMGAIRPLVLSSSLDPAAREELFKRLIDSDELLEALAGGQEREARAVLARLLRPLELPPDFELP